MSTPTQIAIVDFPVHEMDELEELGVLAQPVAAVEWVDPALLHANNYNPNHVARPEKRLLALSILQSGWTQPLVARRDGEIIDGFHRWEVAMDNEQVRALTGGLVPVVFLDFLDDAEQRMATIRHNRARGKHHVVRMADIVQELIDDYDRSPEDIARLLEMDSEEVSRLYDRGSMTMRHGEGKELGAGWVPQ